MVGDPQERNHFHGRLFHKKTLFLGLRANVIEPRVSRASGRGYLAFTWANGLHSTLPAPRVLMMCGYRPMEGANPPRLEKYMLETLLQGNWLGHVESYVVTTDRGLFLENAILDFQHIDGTRLFSKVYGRT